MKNSLRQYWSMSRTSVSIVSLIWLHHYMEFLLTYLKNPSWTSISLMSWWSLICIKMTSKTSQNLFVLKVHTENALLNHQWLTLKFWNTNKRRVKFCLRFIWRAKRWLTSKVTWDQQKSYSSYQRVHMRL